MDFDKFGQPFNQARACIDISFADANSALILQIYRTALVCKDFFFIPCLLNPSESHLNLPYHSCRRHSFRVRLLFVAAPLQLYQRAELR